MALVDLTPDQLNLAECISSISEQRYRASWMQGIERDVWEALNAPSRSYGALSLTLHEVQQLNALCSKCGGWIMFDDANEETFIPIDAWMNSKKS